MKQARLTYCRWAAKHECEELKDGVWLKPALAAMRMKTKDDWTDKHRHVARKLVLEGGWVQKRLFDIGWSNESKCHACHKEEGSEKHRLFHCPGWNEVRGPQEVETHSDNVEEGKELAKRYCYASSKRRSMEQGPFQYDKVGVRVARKLEPSSRRV